MGCGSIGNFTVLKATKELSNKVLPKQLEVKFQKDQILKLLVSYFFFVWKPISLGQTILTHYK